MTFKAENKRASLFVKRRVLSFSSFIMAIVVGVVSSFTYTAAYDMARDALYGRPQRVSGVWRGEWHGVPAVIIRLEQEGDYVSGTARFFRVVATEEGPKLRGTESAISLANTRLDGRRLTFEIYALDEIHPTIFVEMEMSFENEEEAVLRPIRREPTDAPVDAEEQMIKLRREPLF